MCLMPSQLVYQRIICSKVSYISNNMILNFTWKEFLLVCVVCYANQLNHLTNYIFLGILHVKLQGKNIESCIWNEFTNQIKYFNITMQRNCHISHQYELSQYVSIFCQQRMELQSFFFFKLISIYIFSI